MAKQYPLEVENIGEDAYILMSRGHHDIHAFMREVRELYNWPLGVPEHIWMKTRPARPGSGYRCFYDVVPQGTRGAWPATHVQEAWGEDSYESKFPRETRPATELAAAKANPGGAWLSPAAQALYEAEGAARFAEHHPAARFGRPYDPKFKD